MMRNKKRITTNPLLMFFFIFCSSNISASQLVKDLPSKLTNNWQVCSLFKQLKPECLQKALPLEKNKIFQSIEKQTYIKNIIFSSMLKKSPLGLWIENIDDVDEVYLNQQLIGKTGKLLPDFESGFRNKRLYFIPNDLIQFNQMNQLKIVTFSSRKLPGIHKSAPIIGNYLELQHHLQEQDYSFVIAATILLLLALFQVFYFSTVRGKNETIYCALFLITFAAISLLRSLIPIDFGLNLSSAFKLEIFLINIAVISVALFVFNFFELEIRRIFSYGLISVGISSIMVIIWPDTINLRLVAEYNYLLLVLVSFFIVGSALVLAIRKQKPYALILSSTISIGWLFLFYDFLMHYVSHFQFDLKMQSSILPIYVAISGIIFTLSVTHKFWKSFKGATYDHLTGTLLRPAFFQRLSEEMQRCQRGDASLLVAVIDIQQVRSISTNLGYSIGNQLLMTVSNSLTKVLRPFDLICRISDEQFCIAATVQNQEDAESCLKRAYEELVEIKQPVEDGVQLYVDTRVGGILYNKEQHLSVSQLLQDANYALSKAKSQSVHNYLLIQSPIISV